MTTPPQKRVTQQYLNDQFDNNGWEKSLASYTRVEIYNRPTPKKAGQTQGTSTIGYEYYDADNKAVAIVFHYEKPDKTLGASGRRVPKSLLIDGVWCYV
jgi:hypothetical protein